MLNARGVSWAGAKLRFLDPKHVITCPNKVVSYKLLAMPRLATCVAREKRVLGTGSKLVGETPR
jgi:hypothetical protein